MLFSPLSVTICCLISTAVGVLVGRSGGQIALKMRNLFLPTSAENRRQTISNNASQLERDPGPSTNTDGQARQTGSRMKEIAHVIENPDVVSPEIILSASKTLLSFNRDLQSDLMAAKKEIQRQRDLMSECLTESRTDSLTNIANRRAFDYEMTRVVAQRRREGSTFSIVMLDIDHFKRINDQYGHIVGDQVLKDFASILLKTFRASDFVARFGGEEFVAILPNCSIEESCHAAERVRRIINGSWIRVGNLQLQVTASFGIKEIHELESEAELLERTDSALYAAKRNGRDCCYYYLNDECRCYDADQIPHEFDIPKTTHERRDPSFLDRLAAEFDQSNDRDEFIMSKAAEEVMI